jgi:hypothetical protein
VLVTKFSNSKRMGKAKVLAQKNTSKKGSHGLSILKDLSKLGTNTKRSPFYCNGIKDKCSFNLKILNLKWKLAKKVTNLRLKVEKKNELMKDIWVIPYSWYSTPYNHKII